MLVSRTRRTASHNTTVVGGADAIERLAELRRTGDGDIGVGGATLATALLRAHLLDELLLFTHPVVLGAGRALFDGLGEPLQLDLLEQRSFASGVTMHRHAVRGAALTRTSRGQYRRRTRSAPAVPLPSSVRLSGHTPRQVRSDGAI